MADEPRNRKRDEVLEPARYEPPRVEDLPTDEGSAVTAEGIMKSPPRP